MTQSTYLCYCIGVTHESLYYATKAYEPLQDPLRFIRLVQQRLARRTLSCQKGDAFVRLPVEIWELIKHELVDLELERARADMAARIKEHPCEEQDESGCGAVDWHTVRDGCVAADELGYDLTGVSSGDELVVRCSCLRECIVES